MRLDGVRKSRADDAGTHTSENLLGAVATAPGQHSAAAATGAAGHSERELNLYRSFGITELRAKLAARDRPVSGLKEDLAIRLASTTPKATEAQIRHIYELTRKGQAVTLADVRTKAIASIYLDANV